MDTSSVSSNDVTDVLFEVTSSFTIDGTDVISKNVTIPKNFHIPTFALTVRCLVMVTAIIGNILVLRALYSVRHSWKESFSFILNACIYDFLMGSLVMPNVLLTRNLRFVSAWISHYCHYKGVMVGFIFTGQACSIFYLALDRFIFITTPLRYYTIVTPKFTKTATTVTALAVLSYSVFMYKDFNMPKNEVCIASLHVPASYLIAAFASLLIIVMCTTLLHCIVGMIAFRQNRALKRTMVLPAPVPGCSQIESHDSGDDQTTTTVEIVDNYKVLQKAVTLVEELPNGSESSKGADISEDSMRDSEMVNPSTTVNKDLDKSEYNLIELLAWFTIKWDKHPQNT